MAGTRTVRTWTWWSAAPGRSVTTRYDFGCCGQRALSADQLGSQVSLLQPSPALGLLPGHPDFLPSTISLLPLSPPPTPGSSHPQVLRARPWSGVSACRDHRGLLMCCPPLLVSEGEEGERENICVEEKHRPVASCTCPDRGLNPRLFGFALMFQPTEPLQPGRLLMFFRHVKVKHKIFNQ